MINLKQKKKSFIIAIFIYLIGIIAIFIQTKSEYNRIMKQREKYYIIMDANNKDILKIDKKYFFPTDIEKIKLKQKDNEKVYTIEDKKLIEDIMKEVDFGKFIYNQTSVDINEDIKVEIFNLSNLLSISLSKDDKNAILNYENKKFSVTVNDNFYNFIYELFNKISGEEKVDDN